MVVVPWRNILSPEFGQSSRDKYLIFGASVISLKHGVAYVERNLYA